MKDANLSRPPGHERKFTKVNERETLVARFVKRGFPPDGSWSRVMVTGRKHPGDSVS